MLCSRKAAGAPQLRAERRGAARAAPRRAAVPQQAPPPLGTAASALCGTRVAAAAAVQRRRAGAAVRRPRASLVPEFAPSQVTVDEPLGEGSFGQVYLGTLRRPGQQSETGAFCAPPFEPRAARPLEGGPAARGGAHARAAPPPLAQAPACAAWWRRAQWC
jgi:hypothetical protein